MHNLLSTQARLHRMGSAQSPKCKSQGCNEVGTLEHELIYCSKNDGVGHRLLLCLDHHIPQVQAQAILRLDHGDISDELSLPITLLTAITLSYIWKERASGSNIRAYKIRAELEQYIALLRTTRFESTVIKLADMINLMFQ